MASVRLDANVLEIGGEPKILLCTSLFYFRIPREDWETRMAQVSALGYNCADVYIPWNFHELRPGEWDFEGMRDVETFLKMAAKHGLFVVARPGPYICSEWDGGALPGWLYESGAPLRQNNPAYLAQLDHWYRKILPVIARNEVGRGGSVVAVQLENELDYFACEEPEGYLGKLRETARALGISVPLTACAGQCDVQGAGGRVPGVYPTFNAYCDDNYAYLESQLAHMKEQAAQRGVPLLITETNRAHALLKRELASGARLISPYNQVGGSDIDMTNGISNWSTDMRRPLALMTTDYDFTSMLTVDGRMREEAGNARLLGSLLRSLGAHLATAEPCEPPFQPVCDFSTPLSLREDGREVPCYPTLRMDCGMLVGITNLSAGPGTLRFPLEDGEGMVRFHPGETKLLPWQLSLAAWNTDATILWAEAELCALEEMPRSLRVTFVGDAGARVMMRGGAGCVTVRGEEWTAVGGRVWARILETERAVKECPCLPFIKGAIPTPVRTLSVESVKTQPFSLRGCARPLGHGIRWMETAGIYRGDVFYEASLPDDAPVFLPGAADLVWARHGETCEAHYGDGSGLLMGGAGGRWSVRTQCWGHSNFDDVRQPALKMGSKKGICAMIRVLEQRDITGLWTIYPEAKYGVQNRPDLRQTDRIYATTLQSWNYPVSPMKADYVRNVNLRADCDSFWLHREFTGSRVQVRVNGESAGEFAYGDTWLELLAGARKGGMAELCLSFARRAGTDAVGKLTLVAGKHVRNASMLGVSVEDWQAIRPHGESAITRLPLALKPGEEQLTFGFVPHGVARGRMLILDGTGLEATLIAGGHVCGRIVLPTVDYPEGKGGAIDRVYLPAGWADETACLHLCGLGTGGVLRAMRWEETVDETEE